MFAGAGLGQFIAVQYYSSSRKISALRVISLSYGKSCLGMHLKVEMIVKFQSSIGSKFFEKIKILEKYLRFFRKSSEFLGKIDMRGPALRVPERKPG